MRWAAMLLLGFCLASGLGCTERAEPTVADDPPEPEFVFAVPVGATSVEIMDLLRESDLLTGEFESEPLREGWLAPGDYVVVHGTPRSELLSKMVKRQEGRLAAIWDYRAQDLPLANPAELLVLASLVQCESPGPELLDPVASVFVNRLRRGMRLQSDAALIYGITRGKRQLDRPLQPSNLTRDTPWNSYSNEGLPQTPICAPSIAAIRAASYPPKTDYVYFVSDAAGGLRFAESLQEHIANVAKFREATATKGRK